VVAQKKKKAVNEGLCLFRSQKIEISLLTTCSTLVNKVYYTWKSKYLNNPPFKFTETPFSIHLSRLAISPSLANP
jgi:hypothetical protein